MIFNGKIYRKYFISSSAYSLIMWLMRSPKNFEKIANLKIWQLISIWGSKTHFGKTPLKWCIFGHEINYFLPIWLFSSLCPYKMQSVQGLLTGFDILWRPLRPTKKHFLIKMKVTVYSWGLGIWVSSTSFQKINIV